MEYQCNHHRRSILTGLTWMAGIAGLGLSPLLSGCVTGRKEFSEGVINFQGDVRFDGVAVTHGMKPASGGVITTGVGGRLTVVIGSDALLIHENSELHLIFPPLAAAAGTVVHDGPPSASPTADAVRRIMGYRLKRGGVLSVFSPGLRTVQTPNATIGIRGTGIYLEYQPGRSYLCTCYGQADMQSVQEPSARETVQATHHDAPRFIHDPARGVPVFEKAPMFNHTDDELILLEDLVGRQPPFVSDFSWNGGKRY
ncbi:MAG: hypothetical protein HQL75_08160 [Magnetococcales bacterium]|nr:hypothetical protein [Magnetococcales bacterium]